METLVHLLDERTNPMDGWTDANADVWYGFTAGGSDEKISRSRWPSAADKYR